VEVTQPDAASRPRPFVLDRGPRLAAVVFVVLQVVALGFYALAGRNRWFFHDEWHFLVAVDGGDIGDLLEPFNGHWVTLPKLLYRIWFHVFGLNSYLPYQLVTIALQLAAAALLRVVMRRSGVSPWLATTMAGVFLFFGAGDADIVRAFQVTFAGALVLGLADLVLTDHDGGMRWSDAIGLLAGLGSLMCSGVGLAMLVVVGVAVLVRRGWFAAIVHTVPLAAIYIVWYLTRAQGTAPIVASSLGAKALFVGRAAADTFHSLASSSAVGLLLGILTAAGLSLACVGLSGVELRRKMSSPVGLLVGAGAFAVLTAWSRAGIYSGVTEGRYLHVLAAMLAPAVAVAADAVVRRWSYLIAPVMLLLLVGVPTNVRASWSQDRDGSATRPDRELFTAFPVVAEVRDSPDSIRPDVVSAPDLTLGWLRGAAETGRLPGPGEISAQVTEGVVFRASVQFGYVGPSTASCPGLSGRQTVHLEPGDQLPFSGAIEVRPDGVRPTEFNRVAFQGGATTFLHATRGPIDVVVLPVARAQGSRLCTVVKAR
jgi:hypothetical protein